MKNLFLSVFLILAAMVAVSAQLPNTTAIRWLAAVPSSCSASIRGQALVIQYGSSGSGAGLYLCSAGTYSKVASFTGGAVTSPILGAAGSASAPTYSFSGDTNTGMFSDGADVLAFTTGGVEKWVINSSGAFNPILAATYDIGGSTTIRDIGIGRNAIFSPGGAITTTSNGNITLTPNGTGVITASHALVSPSVSLTDNGSTIATNAALGNTFRVTALTASVTLSNPTNPSDGQRIVWEVIQNASAAKTLAFDTQFGFGAEITACTISATLSKHNFITAIYNSTTTKWYVVGCLSGY
jgi:hypothetical protein